MTPLGLSLTLFSALALLAAGVAGLLHGGGADAKRLKRRMAGLAPRAATQAAQLALSKAAPDIGWAARSKARVASLVGYDAAVPNPPLPGWMACLLCLVLARGAVWLAAAVVGSGGWLVLPPAWFLLIRSYFKWCSRRWQTALFKQFPDALSTIVRTVRVGVSMPEGIRRVAQEAPEPTAAIFKRIADELSIGTPLNDAMATSAARTGLPEYRFFTTALVLQSRTGGGLAATLDGLADVIRKRVAVRARGKALASEARASAAVLALLPVVTIGGMLLLNPDYMALLFTSPTGHTILAAACVTEGLGILVMRTMIIRSLS